MRKKHAVFKKHVQIGKARYRINNVLNLLLMELVQNDVIVDQVALFVLIARKPVMAAHMALW